MFAITLAFLVVILFTLLCLMCGIVFFCACKMTESFLNYLLGIISCCFLHARLETGPLLTADESHLFHISKHSVMDMDILFHFSDRILELFQIRKDTSLLIL